MLRSGVVAFLDPEVLPPHLPGVTRAAEGSGMKAALAISFEARHGYGTAHDAGQGHRSEEHSPQEAAPAPGGRVSHWLGPRAMSAMTPELATSIAERAVNEQRGITFHCSEDPRDHDAVRAEHGVTPVGFAKRCGLLTSRSVLAHAVYLELEDFAVIAASGATIVHCPYSNAKTGKGIADLPRMLSAGINVALGTDGGMSNDSYDILLELKMTGSLHRAATRDAGATDPEVLLDMATVNGARVLGTGGGVIAPGRAADLMVIDLRRLGSWPSHDALDTLIFSSTRHVVETVLIDGDVMLDGGHPTGLDEAAVMRDAEEVAMAARSAALGGGGHGGFHGSGDAHTAHRGLASA
jgi:5-methylthioadenosine/S-adenosylhomocysteine deaminase